MLPTTMHSAEVTVAVRHIANWPRERSEIVPADCWSSAPRVAFRLPALKRAVPVCRSLARAWLDGQRIHDDDTRYLMLLVLSELCTNAIQYSAGTRVTCRIWRSKDLLHIEVHDRGVRRRCPGCATRAGNRNTAAVWSWWPCPPRAGAAVSRPTAAARSGPRCRCRPECTGAWCRKPLEAVPGGPHPATRPLPWPEAGVHPTTEHHKRRSGPPAGDPYTVPLHPSG